jgi:cardiolipin synthase
MTLANFISLFRLVSAPFVGYFLFSRQFKEALILFSLASISDALDGYIARRCQEKTLLGRYLDPIADKVLLSTTYFVLWNINVLPSWFFFTLIIRDSLIVLGAYWLYKKGCKDQVKPNLLGKISTLLQIILIIQRLIQLNFPSIDLFPRFLLYTTEISLVLSGIFYGWGLINRTYKNGKST